MKAIKQLLLKVIVLLTTIFLAFSGCRKYDTSIVEKDDYEILQKQFLNTESTNDVEIKKLAKDIKRQDSIFKFLPAFIQKNGIPKWDKVLYRTKNKNGNTGKNPGLGDGQVSTFTENSSNTASQGVFFIPLQSTTSSEIKSYITAYKHNDSLYTYRLYNKDSLGEVHATNAQEKSNLLNTEAVFGYFEKSVNNKDSVTIGNDGNKTVIKNANIAINEKNNSSIKNLSTTTLYAGGSCEVTFEISITYFQADYYINGYYVGSVYGMEFYMSITISCSGGGGGDCGCGNPGGGVGNPSGGGYGDPNGGYDPNNPGGGNWWNSGTGWPWNNPYYYAGYDPNNPNPYNPGWGWWWNGGGGSGNSNVPPSYTDDDIDNVYGNNDPNTGPHICPNVFNNLAPQGSGSDVNRIKIWGLIGDYNFGAYHIEFGIDIFLPSKIYNWSVLDRAASFLYFPELWLSNDIEEKIDGNGNTYWQFSRYAQKMMAAKAVDNASLEAHESLLEFPFNGKNLSI